MDAQELFVHELGDALGFERSIAKMLPKMTREAKDEKIATRLKEHLGETEQQAKNLEQVFRLLGARPKAERCPGIEGIRQEHEEAPKPDSPDLADVALLAAAARVEHYEIAAYEGLVSMARAMGQKDAVRLLEENLKQEQAMLRDGKAEARRLAQKVAREAKRQQDGGTRRARSGAGRRR
jgi:ferritin-like metal-binding protein YciE